MACGATLKRSLEFDPVHSPGGISPKRMCFAKDIMSPISQSKHRTENVHNPVFTEAAHKFVNGESSCFVDRNVECSRKLYTGV